MSAVILPKERQTFDQQYENAKRTLNSFIFDTKNLTKKIDSLGTRALELAKFYSKFCETVTDWFPDSSASVRQSLSSITQAANILEAITTEQLINKLDPNFKPAMAEYDAQIKSILDLKKKRKAAVRDFDREREKLRMARASREPDQNKIDHYETQTEAAFETYTRLNDEFVNTVEEFTETRRPQVMLIFKTCMAILCQYLNEIVRIQSIPFPQDTNSGVEVDAHPVQPSDNNPNMMMQPNQPPVAPNNPQMINPNINPQAINPLITSTQSDTIHPCMSSQMDMYNNPQMANSQSYVQVPPMPLPQGNQPHPAYPIPMPPNSTVFIQTSTDGSQQQVLYLTPEQTQALHNQIFSVSSSDYQISQSIMNSSGVLNQQQPMMMQPNRRSYEPNANCDPMNLPQSAYSKSTVVFSGWERTESDAKTEGKSVTNENNPLLANSIDNSTKHSDDAFVGNPFGSGEKEDDDFNPQNPF